MSTGTIIGLGVAGGVSVLLAVTLLITLLFARSLSDRKDRRVDELDEARKQSLAHKTLHAEAQATIRTLEHAKEVQDETISVLEGRTLIMQEQLDDLIQKLGANAPATAVLSGMRAALASLRAELGGVRAKAEAVPAGTGAQGGSGGEAGAVSPGTGLLDPYG